MAYTPGMAIPGTAIPELERRRYVSKILVKSTSVKVRLSAPVLHIHSYPKTTPNSYLTPQVYTRIRFRTSERTPAHRRQPLSIGARRAALAHDVRRSAAHRARGSAATDSPSA